MFARISLTARFQRIPGCTSAITRFMPARGSQAREFQAETRARAGDDRGAAPKFFASSFPSNLEAEAGKCTCSVPARSSWRRITTLVGIQADQRAGHRIAAVVGGHHGDGLAGPKPRPGSTRQGSCDVVAAASATASRLVIVVGVPWPKALMRAYQARRRGCGRRSPASAARAARTRRSAPPRSRRCSRARRTGIRGPSAELFLQPAEVGGQRHRRIGRRLPHHAGGEGCARRRPSGPSAARRPSRASGPRAAAGNHRPEQRAVGPLRKQPRAPAWPAGYSGGSGWARSSTRAISAVSHQTSAPRCRKGACGGSCR